MSPPPTQADELREANERLDLLAQNLAEARDRAEKASRAKSRFLAGISHELRTPLNGILGYAQLLRREGGLNPIQEQRVDAMLGAGQHLLAMINRVLDLSEVENERFELKPAEVELTTLAQGCLDQVRPGAEAKQLTLRLVVIEDAPRFLITDPTRLRQVLLNLLANAVKFTTEGSVELWLSAGTQGSVRAAVVDTGPGVPPARRARLFEHFERLDAAPEIEGAGLGLAITARLLQLMGGHLGYEDNPAGGSCFWVELPSLTKPSATEVAPHADPLDTDTPPSPRPHRPHRALRLLVVDDVATNRDIARSFLCAAGHNVVCVDGGTEAIAAASASDFDAVLMDVRMPEVDGLEATRRIRAVAGARGRVPIIAVTALAFAEQVAACRQAGVDAHLAKPFTRAALLEAVREATLNGCPAATPTTDAAAESAVAELDLPILNQQTFYETSSFLDSDSLSAHLRTIVERGDALLARLADPKVLVHEAQDLADATHRLAGSAGMFGFDRVAAIARGFEQALRARRSDLHEQASELARTIEASLSAIGEREPVVIQSAAA
jgi:CheY-like chemotaxis protein/HPt (histidine-containing phosphotransfer) domain-containing protein/anti-sigma regulatory factor (Ser/Thr protein kinase)